MATMSSHEFTEWMAFAQLEPFGEERADFRAALIAMIVANANRDPKRKQAPYTIDDFMLFREKDDRPQRTQAETAELVAQMLGAPTT